MAANASGVRIVTGGMGDSPPYLQYVVGRAGGRAVGFRFETNED